MEEFNTQEVAKKIIEKLQKERSNLNRLNVMVLGKSGVGKSTLINNVFGESLAETGVGKPITQKMRKYEKENFPISIYDTPGFELGGTNAQKEILEEVNLVMKNGAKTGNISEAIHCIWYCVSSASHRFEDAEKDFVDKFTSEASKYNVPVIIVLTQSFSKKDTQALKDEIEKENLDVAKIVPVLADNYEIDEDYIAKSYGLDNLVEVMEGVIPEAVRNTLVTVQKASISLKKKKARAIVASAAVTAAAAGAVPIPFSDAALLVPDQIAMLAGITGVFGLPIEKSSLAAVISSTIGTSGATVLGKTAVTGILKCIPGIGSIVGGAISASIASTITTALGEAYIGIMTLISSGEMKASDLETDEGKATISKLFKEKLSVKR